MNRSIWMIAGGLLLAGSVTAQHPDDSATRMRWQILMWERERLDAALRPARERARKEAELAEWNRRLTELIASAEALRNPYVIDVKAPKRLRRAMDAVRAMLPK